VGDIVDRLGMDLYKVLRFGIVIHISVVLTLSFVFFLGLFLFLGLGGMEEKKILGNGDIGYGIESVKCENILFL